MRKGQKRKPKAEQRDQVEAPARAKRARGGAGADKAVQASNKTDQKEAKPASRSKQQSEPADSRRQAAAGAEEEKGILINRAPVLTLWVSVVAQHEGHSELAALTYGRWVAGMMAHSKGRALGLYEDHEKTEEEKEERRRQNKRLGVAKVQAFGLKIPTVAVDGERRALSEGKPITPQSVQQYLQRAFGNKLDAAKAAMEALAKAISADELGKRAYHLYEEFRPDSGWGQKAPLKVERMRELAAEG